MPDRIHNIVYQFSQELNKIIGKNYRRLLYMDRMQEVITIVIRMSI